ncbi:MAG: ABC transporter ATP-binding protein [Roseiflexaceae bacterium]
MTQEVYTPHQAATSEPPVIDARRLGKTFGSTAVLRDLSLCVEPGTLFGLIGPSGSGKTTTVQLCCGHLRPSAGELTVLGETPTRFSASARRRLGYLPQQFVLHPDLTVEQNVHFAAGLYGLPEWRCRAEVRALLEWLDLWDARQRPARRTSGGMQRRIALAAALIHAPDLLFADEPTANLDPILRLRIWQRFRAFGAAGRTLLITTQYIDEAEYCDRVGLMYDGALIAQGQPEELRRAAFGGDVLRLTLGPEGTTVAPAQLLALPDIRLAERQPDGALRLVVASAAQALPLLLAHLDQAGARVETAAQERPTFDEVFIRLIEQHGAHRPAPGRLQTSAADAGESAGEQP